jgi:ORF6N domain
LRRVHKALNQALKRNAERFPVDFAFQLASEELTALRSQFVTSNEKGLKNQVLNGSPSGAASSRGGRRYLPWVFGEHGALMAANVLRSKHAVQMSIFVVRAFVRLREQVATNAAILTRLAEIDRTLLQHDAALRDVYRKLLPLLAPPPEAPKRRIGF